MDLEIKKLDEAGFDKFFSILSQMSQWENRGSLSGDVKERLYDDYFCDYPKYYPFLAWADGKVAGFIVFLESYATFDAKSIMYIEDLFLLPEYRKQGIGKMLFEKALGVAKESGYSRVELLAFGEGPRKFYEKFGFKCEEQNHHYRKFL